MRGLSDSSKHKVLRDVVINLGLKIKWKGVSIRSNSKKICRKKNRDN